MARSSCGGALCDSRGIAPLYQSRLRATTSESPVRYSYATHLECSLSGESHDLGRLQGLSRAGKPLLVRYGLAALAHDIARDELAARAPGFTRWHELLPLPAATDVVSLGEVDTPLDSRRRVQGVPRQTSRSALRTAGTLMLEFQ